MGFGRDMKSLLWHIIGGTRGGETRARIIKELRDRPFNPNQLSENLDLDYKTVTYHLRKLEDNGLVKAGEEDYGKMYKLSEQLDENIQVFDQIWEKIDKQDGGK
jgi:DNA-binding transcriptional ArsR family regulator